MAFLPGLFGGDNTVGFFGGGKYVPGQDSYQLPNMQNMQDENWARGADAQVLAGQAAQSQAGWGGQQQQLANSLFGQLSGNQPSVAQQQLQQTTQGNVANAYAMAQAGHGNPAAARMAATNAANVNQQAAGQGALLRAQEMQNAQGMLGGVLSGARGQDQGMYGMGSQGAQNWSQMNQGMAGQQLGANMGYDQARQQAFSGAQQNAMGGKILNAAAGIGGAIATGGLSKAMAHGGMVQGIMGDTRCAGCGRPNSECECWKRAMGGLIPGYAKGGDSRANDTVPTMLSPGEAVIPRSIMNSADAPDKAKAFVEAIRKKHMRKKAA